MTDDDEPTEIALTLTVGMPDRIAVPIGTALFAALVLGWFVTYPEWFVNVLRVLGTTFVVIYVVWLQRDMRRIVNLVNGPRPATMDGEDD